MILIRACTLFVMYTNSDVIRHSTPEQIRQLETDGKLALTLSSDAVTLNFDDVRIKTEQAAGLAISTTGEWTVTLNTNLDEALLTEGLAREFVNRVQNMRKDAGFDAIDRIHIRYDTSDSLHQALQQSLSYVKNETLAETLKRDGVLSPNTHREEWEINGDKTIICIERI